MLKKFVIPAVALLMVFGCASAKIQSNVRTDYKEKVEKLYILLLANDSISIKFYNDLKTILSSKLEQRSVSNMIHIYNNLGLDEKGSIQTEIDTFKPSHILTITQTDKEYAMAASRFERPLVCGATFELLLQEGGSVDAIWKANLTTNGVVIIFPFLGGNNIGSPETATNKILEAFQNDGLIVPRPIQ